MTDFEDAHLLLPKRIIVISFIISMLLDFIPFPNDFFFWLPSFTVLALLYWAIHCPQFIGIGLAFIIGLLVDIGTASPLGQHALACILITFLIQQQQRHIILYSYGLQAIAVFIALVCNQFIMMIIRLMHSHQFNGWLGFISAIVGALLWPLLSKIMLTIINFRRPR